MLLLMVLVSQDNDIPEFKTMCPLMANRPTTGRMAAEYAGFRIFVCCDKCLGRIGGDPTATIKKSIKKGELIGDFLFDINSGHRIERKNAKFAASAGAFVFYSQTEFSEESLAKAIEVPKFESYQSVKNGNTLKWAAKSSGFFDKNGTRYYLSDLTEKNTLASLSADKLPAGEKVTARPYPILGIDD